MTITSGRFYNERELAGRLGLSEKTLQLWRRIGKGPSFVKLGKAVRYGEASLNEWLTASQTGGAA